MKKSTLSKEALQRKQEIETEKKIARQIVELFSQNNFTIKQAKNVLNITEGLINESVVNLQE